MLTRREFTSGCFGIVAAAAGLSRLARCNEGQPLVARIDEALASAVSFLSSKQAADGAWRSEVYGPLKDGPSLTASIAAALVNVDEHAAVQPTISKAVGYLESIDRN